MGFDLNAAREHYTDEEIGRNLAARHNFDYNGASQYYSPTEIAEKLSTFSKPTITPLQPSHQQATPVAGPGTSLLPAHEPERIPLKPAPELKAAPSPSSVDKLFNFFSPDSREGMDPVDIARSQIKLEARKAGLPVEKYKDIAHPKGAPLRRVERFLSGVGQGAVGTVGSMIGAVDWLADSDIARDLSNKTRMWVKQRAPEDPDFFDALASGIGSTGTFFVPGIGIAKGAGQVARVAPRLANWIGVGVATVMESMTEAGAVYNNVLRETGDKDKASRSATITMMANIPLVAVTNKLGVFADRGGKIKRVITSSLMEASQEAGQEIISAKAEGKPSSPGDIATSAGVGALIGGGFGAIGGLSQDQAIPEDVQPRTLPVDVTGTVPAIQGAAELTKVPPVPPTPKIPKAKTKAKFNPDIHSLADFVRRHGGLSTKGRSLTAEMRGKFSIKEGYNLINNKTGLSPDRMREAAAEAGWPGMDEMTDSDFLSVLEADVSAKKQKLLDRRVWHPAKDFEKDLPAFEEPIASTGVEASKGIHAPLTEIMQTIRPQESTPSFIEFPEIVEIAKELSEGKYPVVKKRLRGAAGTFSPGTGTIKLAADVFKDPNQAAQTLAHEIGHAVDWLPDKTMKRGNVLGRIASLKKHMKHTYESLARNPVIHDQLKNLSYKWRPLGENPTPSFLKYRNSSKELYADAVSVLFNVPELLRQEAPDFYDGFFEYLERKPEVKKIYDEIQDRIKSGEVMAHRVHRLRESFRKNDELYGKQAEKASIYDQAMTALVDANHMLIKKVKQAGEANVPPGENPRYKMEEMTYSGAEAEAYMSSVQQNIIKPLKDAGLNWNDLGEYQYHRRVMFERSEKANPQGWTPTHSWDRLFETQEKLGDDRFKALETAAENFWKNRKEMVVDKIVESGIFSDELTELIKDNAGYVTFDVAEYLEKRHGRSAGAKIFKQIGTLKEITNPATATIMKDISLMQAVNRNIAAETTVKFLQDHGGATPADTKWNGKYHEFLKPKDPMKGLILYQKNGKMKGFYVDKFIAESFERNPYEGQFIAKILRTTAQPFRTLFTEVNPGFWMFNVFRDYFRAATNLPKAKATSFSKYYAQGIKPAFRSVYGIPDPVIKEMLKGKMLISIADFRGTVPEDIQIEKLLKRYHITPPTWNNKITKPFGKFFYFLQNIGRGFERTTKVASYKYLKEKFPDLSQEEVGHIVRVHGGSPDFLRLGRGYPIYNNVLLFSNAMKEGYRGDYEAMSRNPTEFWWKKTKYSFMPKLLMYAAATGLIGNEIKKVMDGATEYDKTNYHIVPLGLTPNGKSVYIRVPVDEGSRFLGGIFWKSLHHDKPNQMVNLFDYMAGQAPTLHPAIDMTIASLQYASGRNPYDWFRGRYAIPKQIFEARDMRTHEAFAKWMSNKTGAGIVHRFQNDDVDKVKTELEKILGYPIANNIIGRFIKVTDYGIREQFREVKKEVRMQNTRETLDAKEALRKLVNGETLGDGDIAALAKKPGILDRNYRAMIARKYGWVFAEELLSARSIAERAAVFKKIRELEGVSK